MKVERATSNERANFPFLVQYKATENWSTHKASKDEELAELIASELAERYPRLPVRVLHCKGGPIVR